MLEGVGSPQDADGGRRESTDAGGTRDATSEVRLRVHGAAGAGSGDHAPLAYSDGSPRMILVVEEDVPVPSDVQSSLRSFGFDVRTTVASGSSAIEAVEACHPDLVLMNVRVQDGEDGIAAAAAIRARHPVPIVFLTSRSDDATLARANEQAHPNGYVLRPYRDGELRAAVEVALQRHTLEQAIRHQRSLLAGVLSGMSDAVIAADVEGRIVLVNEAGRLCFCGESTSGREATIYLPDQVTLCPRDDLPLPRALRGEFVRDLELFIRPASEAEGRWWSVNATPLLDSDGLVCGAVAVGRDITDPRAARGELQQRAQTDALTGVYNRWGFMREARNALESAKQSGNRPAVFFIDLNGMKHINDSLGHPQGDRLLVDVTTILQNCFRASDIVGRLGGDEFVVLAPDSGGNAEALRGRLRAAVDAFNERSDRSYRISLSIGLGRSEPGAPTALEDLVEQADRRMYEDKLARGARRSSEPRPDSNGLEGANGHEGELVMAHLDSGTHALARGPSVGEVAYACDEVDIAVAEVAVCVDLLAQPGLDEPETAASDAHVALRRICAVLDGLRSSCQRARDSAHDALTPQPFDSARRRA